MLSLSWMWRRFWQEGTDCASPEVYARRNFKRLRWAGIYHGLRTAPLAHRFAFHALDVFLVLQIVAIVWDLAYVLDDIGLFGDNTCILTGILLVLTKKWIWVSKVQPLHQSVEEFQAYYVRYRPHREKFATAIRNHRLEELTLMYLSYVFSAVLFSTLVLRAMVSNGEILIVRARLPFSTTTPLGYAFVFLCQTFLIAYVLFTIMYIDNVGAQVLSQMSLLFEMNGMEFAALASGQTLPPAGSLYGDATIRARVHELIWKHQQLLLFADRLKDLHEPNLMTQFVCSMLIICLTAFELMFFKGELMQVLRFGAYMLTAFFQIFAWSFLGNQITDMSTSIHEAVSRSNWIVLDGELKKDLLFTMMRAQKAFIIDVYCLFPLTYETFKALMSKAYSIFTLLRTMTE